MPYFIKKGIGKEKGKTCVYKKEDKTKVGCTDGSVKKYLAALYVNENQEDEFDWVRSIDPYLFVKNYYEFYNDSDRIQKMASDYAHLKDSSSNITSLLKDMGVDESMDKGLLKKALIKYYKDNIPQIKRFLSLISYRPMTYNLKKVLDNIQRSRVNESQGDDLDWIRDIEIDLVPGEIYDIKSGNGYYWVPEKFIGKGQDGGYEVYRFKDLKHSSSGMKSASYVRGLIEKGNIREYDPNWSIKDEITFSDNIEDALKGNFVIYFKDGVELDQTLVIQDKLFEMGFSFYTKEPNQYLTNKDTSNKIQFFESFNWDTSNPRYSNMPSDQRDQKKILIVQTKSDDDFRWRSEPDPRLDDQELFLTIKDHDAIVINGDKYITNNINESDDFDWIRKQEPEKTLKKSKSYVVDVRHLRGQPPSSPTSTDYTDLTRLDILSKLNVLGYDISNIDVDSATYFFIEPNDHPGWEYDDEGNLIEYDYWVDYMTTKIDDPTMNGKYHMIDVDQLEFLLDNNLISESEDSLKWIRDVGLGKVDLRNCKPGDILVTRSGKTVTYVRPLPKHAYMDHEIKYDNGSYGSRTHDGYVYRRQRLDTDEDIISILEIKLDNIKKLVNENTGISFEARKWSKIIYDEIISNPEEKTRLIIDGYDHPEAFDGFPIDYIVIDFYDRLTGYGQEHSGYDKDGNYIVHLYIQPELIGGRGGYSLQSALNHEMKHAWEDYNRVSKGLPSIEQTKESQELYNRDYILMLSDQNVRGPIKEILKYYYYLSKLETSAYLENVYDQNPAYERVVREIVSKDFEPFKDRFDLDVNWHLMNTAYDIPFLKKFKSAVDFIDYSAKELRSRALKMVKKINKMKYVHQK